MPRIRGYFHPKTATGRSSLIPAPPWHYSGDLLTIEYRTDPGRVRELLPEPLELAPDDPGAVALIWADWQSCGDSRQELLDPVRSQYREAFAVVRCSYRARTYSRCVHIWVDRDFALARGLHQGYPKKLGSIHLTRAHPCGPAPRPEAGARFGATLAAADRRLAQAVVTLREPSASGGFVNAHPMLHHRWLPAIDKGGGLALDELVETGAAAFEAGPAWRGDAELDLFDAPTEELSRLAVREPIAAYWRQVGVVWDGGTLLESGTSGAGL
ncbi:acetoacetate decarboxylase family protein [Streptomyces yaizuensis]|uniref:Acetoacetate decarboxylase family protein n=1 Tax=Streptomyces yaizuensis TaxID=2989713 RepID=A0ABQ5P8G2_9ACTN|nr:acetoacetate decarboxylase family protein [Streptomyces sp. YSPA8]GLF98884.1 acetoacetate decarboxylase family protein [Streptomyces sp. YSPA8]